MSFGVVHNFCSFVQSRSAEKWRFPRGHGADEHRSGSQAPPTPRRRGLGVSNQMEKDVAYQASFYLLNFWLSWPIYMFATLGINRLRFPYWFWVTLLFLVPLQGFTNALVYFRPRIVRRMTKRKRNKQDQQQSSQQASSSSTATGFFFTRRFWTTFYGPDQNNNTLGGSHEHDSARHPSTTGAGHRNGSFDPSELDDEIEPAAYIAARLDSGELVELDVPVQGIAPFVQL